MGKILTRLGIIGRVPDESVPDEVFGSFHPFSFLPNPSPLEYTFIEIETPEENAEMNLDAILAFGRFKISFTFQTNTRVEAQIRQLCLLIS